MYVLLQAKTNTRCNMLRKCILTLTTALLIAFPAGAQKQEIVKTGWNFGLMPALNYNVDLGFQVGGLGQVYYYGDGSIYPNYFHKIEAHAYYFTKGACQFILKYDSKHLIEGMRVTADVQYMDTPLNGFYGFNGAVSPYDAAMDQKKSDDGSTGIAFFANHQNQFQANLDLQGNLRPNLTWIGGLRYSYQCYQDISVKPYKGEETLFHQYVESGLIPAEDLWGHRAELKAGLVYDSRDFEPNPAKGIYGTVTLTGGLSRSSASKASLVLSADFRQYLSLIPSRLTMAYQLSAQTLVAGSLPFYALPAFGMRGSFGRRVVGNGVAWGSMDLRLNLARFTAFNQNVELGLVGFAEVGGVIRPYKLAEQMQQLLPTIYNPEIATREQLHGSAGGGFFFSLNRNFIVSMQLGKPFRTQDGPMGIYINLGFSF